MDMRPGISRTHTPNPPSIITPLFNINSNSIGVMDTIRILPAPLPTINTRNSITSHNSIRIPIRQAIRTRAHMRTPLHMHRPAMATPRMVTPMGMVGMGTIGTTTRTDGMDITDGR